MIKKQIFYTILGITFLQNISIISMNVIGKKEEVSPYRRMSIIFGSDGWVGVDRETGKKTSRTDTGALNHDLALMLIQEASPILIEASLFDEFLSFKQLAFDPSIFPIIEKCEKYKQELLQLPLDSQYIKSCEDELFLYYQISFDNWYAFTHKNSPYILLLPKHYIKNLLGYEKLKGIPEESTILGLNLRPLKTLSLPNINTVDAVTTTRNNLSKLREIRHQNLPESIFKIMPKNLEEMPLHAWNIFLDGHGLYKKKIAGLSIQKFQELLTFFNKNIKTNFLYYTSCYAGGENLVEPYKPFSGPAKKYGPSELTFPIASGATTVAITSSIWEAKNSFPKNIEESPEKSSKENLVYHFQSPMSLEVFEHGILMEKPIIDFNKFFESLEKNESFEKSLSYVTDLYGFAKNIPLIRFPGTDWFSAINIDKKIAVINKVKTLTHLISNTSFDIADKAALLIYQAALPVPLILHNKQRPIETFFMALNGINYIEKLTVEDMNNFNYGLTVPKTHWSANIYIAVDRFQFSMGSITSNLQTINQTQEKLGKEKIDIEGDLISLRDIIIAIHVPPGKKSILKPTLYIRARDNSYYIFDIQPENSSLHLHPLKPDEEHPDFESLMPKFEALKQQAEELKSQAKVLSKIPQYIQKRRNTTNNPPQ